MTPTPALRRRPMDSLRRWLGRYARVFGALILLAGVISAAHLWSVAHSGESFLSDDLIYAPILLLYGPGVLIQPRLLTAFTNREEPQPWRYKAAAIALVILG